MPCVNILKNGRVEHMAEEHALKPCPCEARPVFALARLLKNMPGYARKGTMALERNMY